MDSGEDPYGLDMCTSQKSCTYLIIVYCSCNTAVCMPESHLYPDYYPVT